MNPPQCLNKYWINWVFGWFKIFIPPKIRFWLRLGINFCHQLWWFIGFSLPWKFEPNPSWLSFWLILGGFTPLFCPKIGFWLREGKNFHHQLWPWDGPRISWKFGLILFSRSWDMKLSGTARHGHGHGTHCDYIENLSPSFAWLGLAWLWLGLRLRFVKIAYKREFSKLACAHCALQDA